MTVIIGLFIVLVVGKFGLCAYYFFKDYVNTGSSFIPKK